MLNKMTAIGRLGKDPELKQLNSTSVCNFSIACSEKWKDKSSGEMKEKTEWLNCKAFGKIGELVNQYLKKGSLAYIEGKLSTRTWDDKDGKKCYATEILVSEVKFLSTKSEDAPKPKAPPKKQEQDEWANAMPANQSYTDDSIPF